MEWLYNSVRDALSYVSEALHLSHSTSADTGDLTASTSDTSERELDEWDTARAWFAYHPNEFKYSRGVSRLNHSYVNLNNQLYQFPIKGSQKIYHRNEKYCAVKLKEVTDQQGQSYVMKIRALKSDGFRNLAQREVLNSDESIFRYFMEQIQSECQVNHDLQRSEQENWVVRVKQNENNVEGHEFPLKAYMLLDKHKKTLFDLMQENQYAHVSVDEQIYLALQACLTVHWLHRGTQSRTQTAYAHLDIKPSNLMLDNEQKLCLIDYENATPFSHSGSLPLGTEYYMPSLKRDNPLSRDMFALLRTCLQVPGNDNRFSRGIFKQADINAIDRELQVPQGIRVPNEGFMQATFDTSLGALKSRQRRETPILLASKLLLAHHWLPSVENNNDVESSLNRCAQSSKKISKMKRTITHELILKGLECAEKATGNEVKQYAIQRMRDQLNDCDRMSLITSTDIAKKLNDLKLSLFFGGQIDFDKQNQNLDQFVSELEKQTLADCLKKEFQIEADSSSLQDVRSLQEVTQYVVAATKRRIKQQKQNVVLSALKIFKHHTWPPSKLTWWLFGWSTKSYKASQLYLMNAAALLGCREKAEIILGNRQPQGPLNGDQSEAINDFGFFKQAHTSKQPDDERPDLSSDANLAA